jgi:hypothetical protein
MQRLIKGLAVGIFCLQWSLPTLAEQANCSVEKLENNLLPNASPVTEIKADSYFRLNCTCPANLTLTENNTPSTVELAIVSSKTNNGSAQLIPPSDMSYSISTNPKKEYPYSVKIFTSDGNILRAASDYSVAVRFDLLNPPQCLEGERGD